MNSRSLTQLGKQLCFLSVTCATLSLTLPAIAQDAPSPGGGREGGGMGMGRGQGVRGTVTAIAGNQVTIKTDEGDTYKVTTGSNTRIIKSRQAAALTDIHVGDMLIAGGEVDAQAKTVGAAMVMVVDAEQVRKMQAEMGKTWIAGKVSAIEDTKITVVRPDGVTQTIAVDENTSFHKRRDSITMADIKIGDPINARGALKEGVFVAAQLNVGGMGGGMGRPMGGPGGAGAGPVTPQDAPKQ